MNAQMNVSIIVIRSMVFVKIIRDLMLANVGKVFMDLELRMIALISMNARKSPMFALSYVKTDREVITANALKAMKNQALIRVYAK
jgi:hypothetical protein